MILPHRSESLLWIVLPALTLLFPFFGANEVLAFTVTAGTYEESLPDTTYETFFSIVTRHIPKSSDPSEIEDITSCQRMIACDHFISRRSRETSKIVSVQQVDTDAVRRYVDLLTLSADKEPRPAVFGETPEKTVVVVSRSEQGQRLQRDESVLAIRDAIRAGMSHAILPVITAGPETDSDPVSIGIRELLAEGTTSFRGSPKNRIFNINRALQDFQGILIAPGEEFSFVRQLGEVDGEHGYLPELVIKNNKTEPEYGGGICQVSSTMFRAVINAGFKITARRNHAYPVSYYKPYGMDATVYIPAPDFRFVNNTPAHVLMFSSVEGTSLTFRLYGTNDGRSVDIDGPHILESNPDGSMKTIFTQTVTNSAGGVLIDDDFPSSYKSPSLFPHPEDFTTKPADWSKKQWESYLAAKAVVTAPKPTGAGN